MRLKDKGLASSEPPMIISDVNGNIIFANSKALTYLYPIKAGDSVSKYVDLDYIKKISLFDKRMDVIVPKNCSFKKVVVKTVGVGLTKTVELSFMHFEGEGITDIVDDKRLFATFSEVIGKEIVDLVELNSFIHLMVDCMKADLRFAYRKFEIEEAVESFGLYTNFYHLCAIAVGTTIMLNEIECRNPIEISIIEIMGEYVLKISVRKNTFCEAEGIHEFAELFPNVAMRLMYIASLCDSDEIKYKFSVRPNRIITSFVISNMINTTGKFSYSSFGSDPKAYLSYFIDMYAPNDIEAEEQE